MTEYYLKNGELPGPGHFQLCLGIIGGMAATAKSVYTMSELLPEGSTWSAFGISKGNLPVMYAALALGGGIRVGLEDTGYISKGVQATNELLVQRAARVVREFGCEPATPDEARKMLSMPRL